MSLTKKQQAFIEHYLTCWNATEAARQAGYSERTAGQIGYENLNKPDIQKVIEQRMTDLALSANEVLARLSEMARLDLSPYLITVDVDGVPENRVDIQQMIDDGKGHLITELYYDASGNQRVKFVDAQTALVHLGRAHGLFTDKVDHSSGGKPIAPQIFLPAVDDDPDA